MTETFFIAYVTAALWSSNDDSGEPLDANFSIDDIAAETLAQMLNDCEAFQRDNATDLALVPDTGREWGIDAQNGHDFWLTRNGHGAGFWDRGYGELGERLTTAANACGNYDLYLGDDGRIHGA